MRVGLISDTHGLLRPGGDRLSRRLRAHRPCRRRRRSGDPRRAGGDRAGHRDPRQRRRRRVGEPAARDDAGHARRHHDLRAPRPRGADAAAARARDPRRRLRPLAQAVGDRTGWRALPESGQRRAAPLQAADHARRSCESTAAASRRISRTRVRLTSGLTHRRSCDEEPACLANRLHVQRGQTAAIPVESAARQAPSCRRGFPA